MVKWLITFNSRSILKVTSDQLKKALEAGCKLINECDCRNPLAFWLILNSFHSLFYFHDGFGKWKLNLTSLQNPSIYSNCQLCLIFMSSHSLLCRKEETHRKKEPFMKVFTVNLIIYLETKTAFIRLNFTK